MVLTFAYTAVRFDFCRRQPSGFPHEERAWVDDKKSQKLPSETRLRDELPALEGVWGRASQRLHQVDGAHACGRRSPQSSFHILYMYSIVSP